MSRLIPGFLRTRLPQGGLEGFLVVVQYRENRPNGQKAEKLPSTQISIHSHRLPYIHSLIVTTTQKLNVWACLC